MADVTTRYSLPYQEATDAPDGPDLGQDLAEATDAALGTLEDAHDARLDTAEADIDTIELATTSKPIGRIYQSVAQTGIADSTLTAVTFDAEEWDTHNFHSTSVNTSRVTPTKAGKYKVTGSVCFASASNYLYIEARLRKLGSAYANGPTRILAPVSQTCCIQVTAQMQMNGSTDYFELVLQHSRTGAATTNTGVVAPLCSTLEWEYLRP